jgi:hypothetical protein
LRPIRATIATATATVATAGLLVAAAPGAYAVEAGTPYGVAVGVVAADAHTAVVTGQWRCSGGGYAHLWVSVKQGPDVNDSTQTSSDYAKSWYDSNYKFADPATPEGMTVACDGKEHTESFTVRRVMTTPWGTRFNSAALKTGPAYVQFCVVWGDEDGDGTSYGAFHDVKR